MYDFYERFYRATETSRAYAAFCERAYGRDLSQHGFADMEQLDFLIGVSGLGPESRALDLGCGAGGIAAHIADATAAHVAGVDYSPEAICRAQARALDDPARLAFQVAEMAALPFPPGSFDAVIAVDTLYFVEMDPLLAQIRELLTPGGRLLAYYSHGADPATPIAVFPRETLPPDLTPVAAALARQGFTYRAWDFTEADYRHARRMKETLDALRPEFEAEGNLLLHENRMGEATGVMAAIEAGCHARYLYRAHPVEETK